MKIIHEFFIKHINYERSIWEIFHDIEVNYLVLRISEKNIKLMSSISGLSTDDQKDQE